eukprot:g2941.t1
MAQTYDIQRYRSMLNKATRSRYFAESVLGAGSFGVVVRALDTTSGQHVAIKFVQPRKMHDYLESEVCNHRALRHPHVIRFKQALEVEGQLAIVMEYANGSTLRQEVKTQKRLQEPLARWIFQQLILAVDYCHRKGIASRDIKCDNILLVQGQKLPIVKLSDFGYSVHRRSNLSTSIVGTLDYMAPEILRSTSDRGYDARKADVWSCGVVLYVMLLGRYPFSSTRPSERATKVKENMEFKILNLDYTLPSYLSSSVRRLLKNILNTVDKRYTISDIMKDPWFLNYFPEEAKTMNDEILRAEKKRGPDKTSKDIQARSEIATIIKNTSKKQESDRFCEYLIPKEADIITDSQIDEAIDEVFIEQGDS